MDKNGACFENYLASKIVDCCYHIHVSLGPGLLESVYEEILFSELTEQGFKVERQKQLPVIWKNKTLDLGFRTDLIVENKVIIEIKSVLEIHPVYPKQLLTYLKLSGLKLGLLINFNSPLIKTGITRIVNGL
jgi:GxxExxY protein